MTLNLSNFRVVKHVTRPLLKLVDNTKYYIQIEAPFKIAEQVKKPKMVEATVIENGVETKKMVPQPPPTIIDVKNIELDPPVSCQMVANEVFKSELQKQYPNDGYVNKYFEIVKNTKAEGKNYNTFGITELALAVEETQQEESAYKAEPVAAAETHNKGGRRK
jgi:hypothetical protein